MKHEIKQDDAERFEELVRLLPQVVFETDLRGRITFCNQAAFRMFGYAQDDFDRGLSSLDMLAPDDHARAGANIRRALQGEKADGAEYTAVRKDGGRFPVIIYSAPILRDGCTIGLRGIIVDITERKRAEDGMRRSLKEKDILLNEVHHRVKNNLQIISSLLNLQAEQMEDRPAGAILLESRNRIHSMAQVHEKLYRARDFSKVDLGPYLRDLTARLSDIYGVGETIQFKIRLQERELSMDIAVPFGLILNELVSNALKHAFAGEKNGVVSIDVRRLKDGRFRFSVSDDGMGLPEAVDIDGLKNLGLQLVEALCHQERGSLVVKRKAPGSSFTVTFPA